MDFEKLFALAKPYLEKNDLGSAHTSRVLTIARNNFRIPSEFEELTICSIILHDIGGISIKEQYEKGPAIAATELQKMECSPEFIDKVCQIVGSHHDHPDSPSLAFKVLYDSDKIVMFSPEEFPIYDSRPGFDWNKMVDLIYSEKGKTVALSMLKQRRTEKTKKQ